MFTKIRGGSYASVKLFLCPITISVKYVLFGLKKFNDNWNAESEKTRQHFSGRPKVLPKHLWPRSAHGLYSPVKSNLGNQAPIAEDMAAFIPEPAPIAQDIDIEIPTGDTTSQPELIQAKEILIVDHTLSWDELSQTGGFNDNMTLDDGTYIITIFEDTTLEDITAKLSKYTGVQDIHLLTHGSAGNIELGSDTLNLNNFDQHQTALSTWNDVLAEGGNLRIYGCEVGQNQDGIDLLSQISETTQADVAASDDLTGEAAAGGDWDLELQFVQEGGMIEENDSAALASIQANFEGVLAGPENFATYDTDTNTATFTGTGVSLTATDAGNVLSVDGNNLVFQDLSNDNHTATLTFNRIIDITDLNTQLVTPSDDLPVNMVFQNSSGDPIITLTSTNGNSFGDDLTGITFGAPIEDVKSIQITATGPESAIAFTQIDFTVPNSAPTNITTSPATITVAENITGGTTVATLSSTDADTGDSHTYSLVSGSGDTDNSIFEISGNELKLKADQSLSYESNTSHSVRVQTTDALGQTYAESITINVSDINEAPSLSVPGDLAVNENSAAGTVVGQVTASDVDSGDSLTYSLSGADASLFDIDSSGQITVASGAVLNYENATSLNITVTVTDGSGLTADQATSITVNNINEAPSISVPNDLAVNESSPAGTVVGQVTASDVDAGDSLTYSLSGADASLFNIDSSGQITVANGAVLDYETAATHNLTVTVTDGSGLTANQATSITVNNVAESTNNSTNTIGIVLPDISTTSSIDVMQQNNTSQITPTVESTPLASNTEEVITRQPTTQINDTVEQPVVLEDALPPSDDTPELQPTVEQITPSNTPNEYTTKITDALKPAQLHIDTQIETLLVQAIGENSYNDLIIQIEQLHSQGLSYDEIVNELKDTLPSDVDMQNVEALVKQTLPANATTE